MRRQTRGSGQGGEKERSGSISLWVDVFHAEGICARAFLESTATITQKEGHEKACRTQERKDMPSSIGARGKGGWGAMNRRARRELLCRDVTYRADCAREENDWLLLSLYAEPPRPRDECTHFVERHRCRCGTGRGGGCSGGGQAVNEGSSPSPPVSCGTPRLGFDCSV